MNKNKLETKKPLSSEELLAKSRTSLSVLQMRSKMGQLVQTHEIKQLKKIIARLLTIKKNEIKNS
ncbi:50S ribosomal protein L29 [endosymbiont GvMRE of Glomus versiforme]|uniref:50S ribosomal protein L29 n=1 Tax=endosymbiont GvMRE of Glomus versiforme TaxID=2039283 RepID=UPI000ED80515|nr:50S ribosomal protein L29 [endosymbiont GvMRE of Glomus versiforme]RHZ35477.1 50S ribosomal protein L29 [endosymbiont GvMRE of Glomus versiforme]